MVSSSVGALTDDSSKQHVVIVDAYAPTRRLAPRFRAAGYTCVRVRSTSTVPRIYEGPFDVSDFEADIVHGGSIEATAREIGRFRPAAVVAGGETGVELADALSERLGLPTNGTSLSGARRDKYAMIEAVRAAGLRAARQLHVTHARELRDWHEQLGGRVVVKPGRSAASEGIRFCDTPQESVAAYHELLGVPNIFSESNTSIVAQEYLVGTEYIVNTVSGAGRHRVCDIWRTTRASVNGVLDLLAGLYIMPRTGPVQDGLVDYARRVLDALGIRYGPAHIEIKVTPTGPCLVEIGARIGGGDNPHYAELATGESQLGWNVYAYLEPDLFHARYDEPYRITHHVASVPMLSPYEGVLRSYPFLPQVEALPSLHEIRRAVEPGGELRRSVDDTTYPLIVNLRHEVEEFVMRDMETLRYLDGHAFYDMAAS
jgi:biotin carboxylase